jgi:hypothetical protein
MMKGGLKDAAGSSRKAFSEDLPSGFPFRLPETPSTI